MDLTLPVSANSPPTHLNLIFRISRAAVVEQYNVEIIPFE